MGLAGHDVWWKCSGYAGGTKVEATEKIHRTQFEETEGSGGLGFGFLSDGIGRT